MSYERLSIKDFGEQLLTTNDLDPVYVALHELADGEWGWQQRNRFLLAYWCFYDVGVACWMAMHEAKAFWEEMWKAARNEGQHPFGEGHRWRRASERRYARGEQGLKMVGELEKQFGPKPEDFVDSLMADTCKEVMRLTKKHYLFGDWIAFKVADMLDRCCSINVSFEQAEVFMFKDPVIAAHMAYADHVGIKYENKKDLMQKVKLTPNGIGKIVEHIQSFYPHIAAPPTGDRPIGLQEVETILCKWKSHMNGHYPAYNDIDEIREQLALWTPHTELAGDFLLEMPEGSDA